MGTCGSLGDRRRRHGMGRAHPPGCPNCVKIPLYALQSPRYCLCHEIGLRIWFSRGNLIEALAWPGPCSSALQAHDDVAGQSLTVVRTATRVGRVKGTHAKAKAMQESYISSNLFQTPL